MNRYPNLVGFSGGALGGHGNGFIRRKIFSVPGSYSFTIPADLPADDRGLTRIKGVVIGGGSGGNDGNAGGQNAGGTGGGYSHKEVWVPPSTVVSLLVGSGGNPQGTHPGNRAGGTSSISVYGVSWQATGGQNAAGGEGSGGDVNTKGGGVKSSGDNTLTISGASSGSPWADGSPGLENGPGGYSGYPKWSLPTFWDLEDFAWLNDEVAAFREIEGVGHGGWLGPDNALVMPAFGGGGIGGWNASALGGGGLVILYF